MDNYEKLGITPIVSFKDDRDLFVCNRKPVRELECLLNYFLELIIEECLIQDKYGKGADDSLTDAIKKADPQHRNWEEIRELLKCAKVNPSSSDKAYTPYLNDDGLSIDITKRLLPDEKR